MSNISTIRIPREQASNHEIRERILQACFDEAVTLQDIATDMGLGTVNLKGSYEERQAYRLLKSNLYPLMSVGLVVSSKPKTGFRFRYKALYLGYDWVMPVPAFIKVQREAEEYGMQIGNARVFKIDHRPAHLEKRELAPSQLNYASGSTLGVAV